MGNATRLESWVRDYTDGHDGYRHWRRCVFNGAPLDQLVFTLVFGGRVAHLGSGRCDVWSHADADSGECACAAPLKLVTRGSSFVEIGANDGFHMSNGLFFERFLGWHGLCIEPNRHVFERLQRNRPGCTNVNALVGNPPPGGQRANFVELFREVNGSKRTWRGYDWETGLSGVLGLSSHPEMATWRQARRFAHVRHRTQRLRAEMTRLPVVPFRSVLQSHGVSFVDFLSLDCEGSEAAVLASLDFARTPVRALLIENGAQPNVSKLLRAAGYRDVGLEMQDTTRDRLWLHGKMPHPLLLAPRTPAGRVVLRPYVRHTSASASARPRPPEWRRRDVAA